MNLHSLSQILFISLYLAFSLVILFKLLKQRWAIYFYLKNVDSKWNMHTVVCLFFNVFILLIYLFGYTGLSCSMQTLSCSIWDLVLRPGIEPRPPALGAQSLSHWATREVPSVPRFFWSSLSTRPSLYLHALIRLECFFTLTQLMIPFIVLTSKLPLK